MSPPTHSQKSKGTGKKAGDTRSSPRINASPLTDLKDQSSPSGILSPTTRRNSVSSPTTSLTELGSAGKGNKKKKLKKYDCPCGRSSDGKDWVLECCNTSCRQGWHSSCAGLKGINSLTEAQVVFITKTWQCPWCYTVPFARPGSHPSSLQETSLIKETLSASLYQNLAETITESIKAVSGTVDLSPIESQLKELTANIEEFKKSSKWKTSHARTPTSQLSTPVHVHVERAMECPEMPYESVRENFLDSEDLDYLKDLLGYLKDSGDFVSERGHGVKLFGEPYTYTGSKTSTPDPVPPELQKIIDKLSTDLSLSEQERPNSILINHFPNSSNQEESFLSMHSDDEKSIKANSKIITLSIGASRTVHFESKNQGEVKKADLERSHNSIYVMTRQSQNWFRHGIPPLEPGTESDERFSLTFRSLHQKFKRSVVILGDSNSRDINFGTGIGKVGHSYPGKRIKTPMVKDIDPSVCTGYSNIFLMCGTNDLRCKYISNENDIHNIVCLLKEKIIEIKQLCPDAKLFVLPVMPSRIPKMNYNITTYNSLVSEMLSFDFPDVWFPGIYSFVDNRGLLLKKLVRLNDDNKYDDIHLGPKGIAKLVTYIKTSIFTREKYEEHYSHSRVSTSVVGSPEPA